jgi:hypothetical protein
VPYPGGNVAAGEIVELDPPRRIVMTWGYEAGEPHLPAGATTIEIRLEPTDGGTLLHFRQTGFPGAAERDAHHTGFRHFLGVLSAVAAFEERAELAPARVEEVTRAWNEHDAARRDELLARCLDAGATFRDPQANVAGRHEIASHIAGLQRMLPGTHVTADPPRLSHDLVAWDWRVTGAHGLPLGAGTNVATLGEDGRFHAITSFWTPS